MAATSDLSKPRRRPCVISLRPLYKQTGDGRIALTLLGGNDHDGSGRPKTRGECIDGPRPCPWTSCRHHLYVDVEPNGSIRLNHPDSDVGELQDSCSLDVADRGVHTLHDVGALLGITRERARQLEELALRKLRKRSDTTGLSAPTAESKTFPRQTFRASVPRSSK